MQAAAPCDSCVPCPVVQLPRRKASQRGTGWATERRPGQELKFIDTAVPNPAGGKFLAGLICGDDTVAVHVVEREVGGARAAFASLTAKHAGPWGLGVYVQMSDGQ
jgi:hypothetical protein